MSESGRDVKRDVATRALEGIISATDTRVERVMLGEDQNPDSIRQILGQYAGIGRQVQRLGSEGHLSKDETARLTTQLQEKLYSANLQLRVVRDARAAHIKNEDVSDLPDLMDQIERLYHAAPAVQTATQPASVVEQAQSESAPIEPIQSIPEPVAPLPAPRDITSAPLADDVEIQVPAPDDEVAAANARRGQSPTQSLSGTSQESALETAVADAIPSVDVQDSKRVPFGVYTLTQVKTKAEELRRDVMNANKAYINPPTARTTIKHVASEGGGREILLARGRAHPSAFYLFSDPAIEHLKLAMNELPIEDENYRLSAIENDAELLQDVALLFSKHLDGIIGDASITHKFNPKVNHVKSKLPSAFYARGQTTAFVLSQELADAVSEVAQKSVTLEQLYEVSGNQLPATLPDIRLENNSLVLYVGAQPDVTEPNPEANLADLATSESPTQTQSTTSDETVASLTPVLFEIYASGNLRERVSHSVNQDRFKLELSSAVFSGTLVSNRFGSGRGLLEYYLVTDESFAQFENQLGSSNEVNESVVAAQNEQLAQLAIIPSGLLYEHLEITSRTAKTKLGRQLQDRFTDPAHAIIQPRRRAYLIQPRLAEVLNDLLDRDDVTVSGLYQAVGREAPKNLPEFIEGGIALRSRLEPSLEEISTRGASLTQGTDPTEPDLEPSHKRESTSVETPEEGIRFGMYTSGEIRKNLEEIRGKPTPISTARKYLEDLVERGNAKVVIKEERSGNKMSFYLLSDSALQYLSKRSKFITRGQVTPEIDDRELIERVKREAAALSEIPLVTSNDISSNSQYQLGNGASVREVLVDGADYAFARGAGFALTSRFADVASKVLGEDVTLTDLYTAFGFDVPEQFPDVKLVDDKLVLFPHNQSQDLETVITDGPADPDNSADQVEQLTTQDPLQEESEGTPVESAEPILEEPELMSVSHVPEPRDGLTFTRAYSPRELNQAGIRMSQVYGIASDSSKVIRVGRNYSLETGLARSLGLTVELATDEDGGLTHADVVLESIARGGSATNSAPETTSTDSALPQIATPDVTQSTPLHSGELEYTREYSTSELMGLGVRMGEIYNALEGELVQRVEGAGNNTSYVIEVGFAESLGLTLDEITQQEQPSPQHGSLTTHGVIAGLADKIAQREREERSEEQPLAETESYSPNGEFTRGYSTFELAQLGIYLDQFSEQLGVSVLTSGSQDDTQYHFEVAHAQKLGIEVEETIGCDSLLETIAAASQTTVDKPDQQADGIEAEVDPEQVEDSSSQRFWIYTVSELSHELRNGIPHFDLDAITFSEFTLRSQIKSSKGSRAFGYISDDPREVTDDDVLILTQDAAAYLGMSVNSGKAMKGVPRAQRSEVRRKRLTTAKEQVAPYLNLRFANDEKLAGIIGVPTDSQIYQDIRTEMQSVLTNNLDYAGNQYVLSNRLAQTLSVITEQEFTLEELYGQAGFTYDPDLAVDFEQQSFTTTPEVRTLLTIIKSYPPSTPELEDKATQDDDQTTTGYTSGTIDSLAENGESTQATYTSGSNGSSTATTPAPVSAAESSSNPAQNALAEFSALTWYKFSLYIDVDRVRESDIFGEPEWNHYCLETHDVIIDNSGRSQTFYISERAIEDVLGEEPNARNSAAVDFKYVKDHLERKLRKHGKL